MSEVAVETQVLESRSRRKAHIIKLCMISAVSRTQNLIVELDDFTRAQKWLLDAEISMPDVFRAMKQKSDEQLIKEAHHWVYAKWSSTLREKRGALPESVLWEFIQDRTTSERVKSIVEALYRSDFIRPGPKPGTFQPQPRNKD